MLPWLYPAACVRLPELRISKLRDWLWRHQALIPPGLTACRDRRLRGGVVAWRGFGLLFADRDDTEDEQRFTLAHEAAHYLRDHLYPRCDLLSRFGPAIQPVLDGLRPPTREERIDALLAHASLTFHTHLLERDVAPDPSLDALEADADAFACEILAPIAALEARFPSLSADENTVREVQAALCADYRLPPKPALAYARAFVAERGAPVTLLHRLSLA